LSSGAGTLSIYVAATHRQAPELVEIALLAEELGFDGMSMADHIFVPVGPLAGYPYSADGSPPFDASTPWTDALVVAAAAAVCTSRLRFATGVYVLPLRHPLVVARALASVDALAPGRVELGVGVGWMRAEFDTLGIDFSRRGALADESIQVLRKLWQGGLVRHDGPNYPVGPLYFEPHPSRAIPILVGGASRAALERAARLGDGYIAMPTPVSDLLAQAGQLRKLRESGGRLDLPFSFHAWSDEGRSVDDYLGLIEAGVDTFYVPAMGTVDEARSSLERFLNEVAGPLRARWGGHV
jgi:probable F420-dependent oxidoreductase